jgi:hypothetical protein
VGLTEHGPLPSARGIASRLPFPLLTAFDEPLEAFAADKSVSEPTVNFLGSPDKQGDYETSSNSNGRSVSQMNWR